MEGRTLPLGFPCKESMKIEGGCGPCLLSMMVPWRIVPDRVSRERDDFVDVSRACAPERANNLGDLNNRDRDERVRLCGDFLEVVEACVP